MNADQIFISIYNYLFSELSRKEQAVIDNSKYLDSMSSNSDYIYRYWDSKKEFEVFSEFAFKIFEILRFFEE